MRFSAREFAPPFSRSPLGWIARRWDLALILTLAAVVYRPWNAPHLPLTDFGIFLAARGASHSLLSQYVGVASYYISEGRFFLLQDLYMVMGSAAFGTWAPGWHWTYFVLNSIALILARNFFSRVGITTLASFIVLSLWVLMGPTAELWVRPAGEVLGVILFLVALHLLLNYADATDFKRRALIVAFCAVGIILSKELLVVLLPVGWLISRLTFRAGRWKWADWTRRDAVLLVSVAAAVLATMIPVTYVALHAHSASYAGQYGVSSHRLDMLLHRLEIVLVPATPRFHLMSGLFSDPAWTIVRILPNLLWVGMTVFCVVAARHKGIGWPLLIGAVWVGAGLVAYFPWPGEGEFYMMPFALGTMFLAATAINGFVASGSDNRRAILGVSALLILVAAIEARSTIDQSRLRAELNGEVIEAIARHGGAQQLVAAVPNPEPGTGGWANHLRGFSQASNGIHILRWRDLKCGDAKHELETTPGTVVVSAGGGCSEIAPGGVVLVESVSRSAWPYLWRPLRSEGRMYVSFGSQSQRFSDAHAFR